MSRKECLGSWFGVALILWPAFGWKTLKFHHILPVTETNLEIKEGAPVQPMEFPIETRRKAVFNGMLCISFLDAGHQSHVPR